MALRRPALLALLLSLLATTLLAGALAADYRDEYRLGVEAFERRDWNETVRRMQSAIAENPGPGGLLRRYTPHFYLGIALAELGRCREALVALDEAARQGKVSGKDAAALASKRTECRQHVERYVAAASAAQEIIDEASAAVFTVAQDQSEPVLAAIWRSGEPSFAERQAAAGQRLARARDTLQQAGARLDVDAAVASGAAARRTLEELGTLHTEAQARLAELSEVVASRLTAIAEVADAARRDLRYVAGNFSPLPAGVGDEMAALQEAVDESSGAGRATPLPDLEGLEDRLRTRLAALRRAVRFPPDDLQAAVAAYLDGRYAQVPLLLAASYRDQRAVAHACLLRAASRHALDRLGTGGEEGDGDEREAATRRQLAECARLPVRVEPPARYFPPAFRAAWAAATAPAAPPQ